MLRFGARQPPPRRRILSPQSRSVWMLLLMLSAVTMLMRQLQRPETEEFLGRVFSAPQAKDALEPDSASANAGDVNHLGAAAEPPGNTAGFRAGPWAAVTDNAIFTSAEQEAWSLVIEQAANVRPADLAKRSLGEVAYAQLANQPEAYRGRVVRIRGTVLREESKPVPPNSLGTVQYHQLWVAPRGGGEWPFVAYVLHLPEEFPRGDSLKQPVAIDGFFFKNWSYPHAKGMGLAPVIVARSIIWKPPRLSPGRHQTALDLNALLFGAGLAAVAAMTFVGWVTRQTRLRTDRREHLPDTIAVETES